MFLIQIWNHFLVSLSYKDDGALCGALSALQKLRQLDLGPVSYSKVWILGSLQIGVRTKVIDFCAKFQLYRGSYEGALEIKGENQD